MPAFSTARAPPLASGSVLSQFRADDGAALAELGRCPASDAARLAGYLTAAALPRPAGPPSARPEMREVLLSPGLRQHNVVEICFKIIQNR